jgi:hypothetical protein
MALLYYTTDRAVISTWPFCRNTEARVRKGKLPLQSFARAPSLQPAGSGVWSINVNNQFTYISDTKLYV